MKKETATELADALQELAKICNDLNARLDQAELTWKDKDPQSFRKYQTQVGLARHHGVPVIVGKCLGKLRAALLQDRL